MKNEMIDNELMNYERAKYFFGKKIKVHVKKKNGIFYNGFITNDIEKHCFIIQDHVNGEELIFFAELDTPIVAFNSPPKGGKKHG